MTEEQKEKEKEEGRKKRKVEVVQWIKGEWNSRGWTERIGEVVIPLLFLAFLAGVIYLGQTIN